MVCVLSIYGDGFFVVMCVMKLFVILFVCFVLSAVIKRCKKLSISLFATASNNSVFVKSLFYVVVSIFCLCLRVVVM